MLPKVSVIIPVYNVEKYVEQAILSIQNQSLKDIEIIVVNDGSEDKSIDIINTLSKTDNRIHIISTPNNGLSIARNIGLYHAKGEYVYFFDSDDILENKALEECYQKCKELELDLLFFDADVFSDSKVEKKFNYLRSHKYDDIVYNGAKILEKQLDTNGYKSSVCLLFLKRNYLIYNNIYFYPKILHEDELFTFISYLKAPRVGLINRVFFHRRVRNNSIMNSTFNKKNLVGYITVCRELLSFSLKYDSNYTEIKLLHRRINNILAIILNEITEIELRILFIQIMKKEFFSYLNWKNKLKTIFPKLYFKFQKKTSIP